MVYFCLILEVGCLSVGCVDLRYRECVVCCLILVVVVVWVGWGVCLVDSCVGKIGVLVWYGLSVCAWI